MAELTTEQRVAKEDYDWGHLRPNEFRMIFIPRRELREPGHADSESSDDARAPRGRFHEILLRYFRRYF